MFGSQECPSKYYKEWHPDYIASYNSLNDRHLSNFFQHPSRKHHLTRTNQMSTKGEVVSEKEWRKQNLEWERRRREAQEDAERRHKRQVDERRERMVLRQQQREEDYRRKKAEHFKDPKVAVREAWTDQEQLMSKISTASRHDVQHLLNFLNFEIKYLLRPKSAPSAAGPPNLHTKRRAQSARRSYPYCSSTSPSRGGNRLPGGYPPLPISSSSGVVYDAQASATLSPEVSVFYTEPFDESGRDHGKSHEASRIRNIEIPDRQFSKSPMTSPQRRHRPSTAPNPGNVPNMELATRKIDRRLPARSTHRPRSPTHPNYKEEEYLLSTVVLRYVGHPDHYARIESRARHRAHRKNQLLPPLPAHVDEVTIEQQPRGSYVLEVFHGYLCVGDEFRFTSRRVEGYPFSLTIYVNRQCHVRLSACCESKRAVGGRLGQGFFQLLHVQGARPCIKCLLEKDPVAQRHVARIQKLRGTYDSMGNRVPPPPQALAEAKERSKKRGRKKARDQEQNEYSDDYGAGAQLEIDKDRLAVPSLSPEPEPESHHPSRSRRKKVPRPKSAPKRSSSSPLADYTSPEEEEDDQEEAFSEEEIKLPIDDDEYEEEEKVGDDPGEFQHLEENSQGPNNLTDKVFFTYFVIFIN